MVYRLKQRTLNRRFSNGQKTLKELWELKIQTTQRNIPSRIIVSFTKDKIRKLWKDKEPWQHACPNFGGERLITTIPRVTKLTL